MNMMRWMPLKRCCPRGPFPARRRSGRVSLSARLKTTSAGIYGGAIGYIDFTGNMDACIAIRIAYQKTAGCL